MATETGENIFARARVIATSMGSDPTQSTIVDTKGGIRALLNHSIRQVYRAKSNDQKFIHDIVTPQTLIMASGTADCPDVIMREFLHQAQFQDINGSLITYFNYNIDQQSGTLYNQLGYITLVGDEFNYFAPQPIFDAYDGDLFVTCPCFPVFPMLMSSAITFPSESTVEDVVLTLALAIRAEIKFDLMAPMAA